MRARTEIKPRATGKDLWDVEVHFLAHPSQQSYTSEPDLVLKGAEVFISGHQTEIRVLDYEVTDVEHSSVRLATLDLGLVDLDGMFGASLHLKGAVTELRLYPEGEGPVVEDTCTDGDRTHGVSDSWLPPEVRIKDRPFARVRLTPNVENILARQAAHAAEQEQQESNPPASRDEKGAQR